MNAQLDAERYWKFHVLCLVFYNWHSVFYVYSSC
jgi:hypothetical protein